MFNHTSIAMGIALLGGIANAGAPHLDFVHIGDPGNRDTIPSEVPYRDHLVIGGVDYEFDIMRTPVTVEQWFEFVDAYKDFTTHRGQDFIGDGSFVDSGGNIFSVRPPQSAVEVSWRYAARYMNWLHNDKALTAEAFENGVYDTSTFGQEQGVYTDQRDPSPGARFWLPRNDEWVKAVYYDPNRYGSGQGGYWLYPDGGMEALIGGLPSEGGETDADGVGFEDIPLDVGSYPSVQTPYGLLDVSGGVTELLSGDSGFNGLALAISTDSANSQYVLGDRIDWGDADEVFPHISLRGFRVAKMRCPCPNVDLSDGLGTVDLGDLNVLLFNFGRNVAPGDGGDTDCDGDVDLSDLSTMLFAFGTVPGC